MTRVFRAGNTGPGVSWPTGPVPSAGGRRSGTYAGSMAGHTAGDDVPPSQQRTRGAALGLPADGPGSLAPFGRRVGQFAIDAIGAGLITALITAPEPPQLWSLLTWAVLTVLFLLLTGQTPGMRLLGMRLAHPEQGRRLAPWRAVVRTLLLAPLIPALVVDADGRGLHDRVSGTAVIRD